MISHRLNQLLLRTVFFFFSFLTKPLDRVLVSVYKRHFFENPSDKMASIFKRGVSTTWKREKPFKNTEYSTQPYDCAESSFPGRRFRAFVYAKSEISSTPTSLWMMPWIYYYFLIQQLELERREAEMRAKREEEERKRLEEALRARQEEECKRLEEEELARQKQVNPERI